MNYTHAIRDKIPPGRASQNCAKPAAGRDGDAIRVAAGASSQERWTTLDWKRAMNHAAKTVVRTTFMLSIISFGVAVADDFEISRSTIDGGGVMRSTGGEFELSGTIGQPDTGTMTGGDGEFELTGGFWFAEPTDDCNSDGWVDLLDYSDLDECLSGPGGSLPFPECNCFDLDGDDDVDLLDIHRFQQAFTGG